MRREIKRLYTEAIKYLQNLSDESLMNFNGFYPNEVVRHFQETVTHFKEIPDKVNYKKQMIDSIKAALLYDQMYGWNKEPLEPSWTIGEVE